MVAGLRPEHLRIATGTPTFHFAIGNIESTGSATYLTSADGQLQLVQSERSAVAVGDRVGVEIDRPSSTSSTPRAASASSGPDPPGPNPGGSPCL